MRSPQTVWIRLILLLTLALGLVSCGSSGGGSDESPQTDTTCVLGSSQIGDCTLE